MKCIANPLLRIKGFIFFKIATKAALPNLVHEAFLSTKKDTGLSIVEDSIDPQDQEKVTCTAACKFSETLN